MGLLSSLLKRGSRADAHPNVLAPGTLMESDRTPDEKPEADPAAAGPDTGAGSQSAPGVG